MYPKIWAHTLWVKIQPNNTLYYNLDENEKLESWKVFELYINDIQIEEVEVKEGYFQLKIGNRNDSKAIDVVLFLRKSPNY